LGLCKKAAQHVLIDGVESYGFARVKLSSVKEDRTPCVKTDQGTCSHTTCYRAVILFWGKMRLNKGRIVTAFAVELPLASKGSNINGVLVAQALRKCKVSSR
jgi:hypothetical protein